MVKNKKTKIRVFNAMQPTIRPAFQAMVTLELFASMSGSTSKRQFWLTRVNAPEA